MRIWFQGIVDPERDPQWEPYAKALAKHAQDVARPGTTIDYHPGHVQLPGYTSIHYFNNLQAVLNMGNALKAEKQGCDVFATSCSMDQGYYDFKQVLNIPIALAMESSCYVASLMARKFGFIGFEDLCTRWIEWRVEHDYGLGERMVHSASANISMGALANGLSDPEPVINAAKKAAKTAIQSGAEILIPASGGLNMTLVHHGIKEINGIPIIDIHGVVIKVAELIVDLKKMGIERVNLGLYTRATKEQVQQSHELFKKYLNL